LNFAAICEWIVLVRRYYTMSLRNGPHAYMISKLVNYDAPLILCTLRMYKDNLFWIACSTYISLYSKFYILCRFRLQNPLIVYFLHACMRLKSRRDCTDLKRILRAQDFTFALSTSTEIFLSYFDHDLHGNRIILLLQFTLYDYIWSIGFSGVLFLKVIGRIDSFLIKIKRLRFNTLFLIIAYAQ
jgi:hypothetical protein